MTEDDLAQVEAKCAPPKRQANGLTKAQAVAWVSTFKKLLLDTGKATPAELAEVEAMAESAYLVAKLTQHQKRVLVWSCKGLDRVQIADAMGCQRTSVDDSRKRIRKKLGVNSMMEAAVIATKARLV